MAPSSISSHSRLPGAAASRAAGYPVNTGKAVPVKVQRSTKAEPRAGGRTARMR